MKLLNREDLGYLMKLQSVASNTLITAIIVAGAIPSPALADEKSSTACERSWAHDAQRFKTIGSEAQVRYLVARAERGTVEMQYRLGLLQSTLDGKWKAPPGFNVMWLQKAIEGGSKSAAAELANLQYIAQKNKSPPQQTYKEFLLAHMAAAQEEANPWSATLLMQKTIQSDAAPALCDAESQKMQICDPSTAAMLPQSDARKWAEIAARGGNPAAQEQLCLWAESGNLKMGQPKNDKDAFEWCVRASHNACSYAALDKLATLYAEGRGVEKDESQANSWKRKKSQLWRNKDAYFFSQP